MFNHNPLIQRNRKFLTPVFMLWVNRNQQTLAALIQPLGKRYLEVIAFVLIAAATWSATPVAARPQQTPPPLGSLSRNTVLVAGNPPLVLGMVNDYRDYVDWVLNYQPPLRPDEYEQYVQAYIAKWNAMNQEQRIQLCRFNNHLAQLSVTIVNGSKEARDQYHHQTYRILPGALTHDMDSGDPVAAVLYNAWASRNAVDLQRGISSGAPIIDCTKMPVGSCNQMAAQQAINTYNSIFNAPRISY